MYILRALAVCTRINIEYNTSTASFGEREEYIVIENQVRERIIMEMM